MNSEYQQALSVLKEFLESPERKGVCLDIDQFQGAVVALLSSPENMTEVSLGFLVLGDDTSGEEAWFDDGEIRSAWVTCLNLIDEALARENFSLYDLYDLRDVTDTPPARFSQWCDGYLRGYLSTEETWAEVHDFLKSEDLEMEEIHMALLSSLATMARWEAALNDSEDPEKLKSGLPSLIQIVNDGVVNHHKLALLLENNSMRAAEEAQPYVRDAEKIGRNAPCPCGSGKKYKKCCLQ